MNRRADMCFFEPTTRYFLIQNILGKTITDLCCNFRDREIFNECQTDIIQNNRSLEDVFFSSLNCYTLTFSDGISIDVTRIRSLIMVKHANRHGHKWSMEGFMYKPIQWSIKEDIFGDWDITQILGQKITNIRCFVAYFNTSPNKYLVFELANKASIIFGQIDKDPFESMLYIAPNNPFFENINKRELPMEVPNLDYEMIEDNLADPSELINDEYIELCYKCDSSSLFSINTDIYWEKLSQKPIENYRILTYLLDNIFLYQMGIVDLRFGISKEGELKLVKPIDLCVKRILDNNVYFINSLMDTIYKHVPEKIEKYYLE